MSENDSRRIGPCWPTIVQRAPASHSTAVDIPHIVSRAPSLSCPTRAPTRAPGHGNRVAMKTLVALLALVALSGLASASVTGHAEATANGETHTVDILIDDSGNASILVDGQPL